MPNVMVPPASMSSNPDPVSMTVSPVMVRVLAAGATLAVAVYVPAGRVSGIRLHLPEA